MSKSNKIVERIDELLRKRNLKRLAVCEFAEISTQAITNWKKQGSMPAADTALKIAEYLDVSVEWLITGITKSTDLPPDAVQIARKYKVLDNTDKKVVENLIDGLLIRYTTGEQMEEMQKGVG